MDIVKHLESINNEDGTVAKTAATEIKKLRNKLTKEAAYHNILPWYRRIGVIMMMLGAFSRDPIFLLIGAAVFMLPA
jgi:hypothetical protein